MPPKIVNEKDPETIYDINYRAYCDLIKNAPNAKAKGEINKKYPDYSKVALRRKSRNSKRREREKKNRIFFPPENAPKVKQPRLPKPPRALPNAVPTHSQSVADVSSKRDLRQNSKSPKTPPPTTKNPGHHLSKKGKHKL